MYKNHIFCSCKPHCSLSSSTPRSAYSGFFGWLCWVTGTRGDSVLYIIIVHISSLAHYTYLDSCVISIDTSLYTNKGRWDTTCNNRSRPKVSTNIGIVIQHCIVIMLFPYRLSPSSCLERIPTGFGRAELNVSSYPPVGNDTSNLSLDRLRSFVIPVLNTLQQNPVFNITNLTIEGQYWWSWIYKQSFLEACSISYILQTLLDTPDPVVTSNNGSTVVGATFSLELQRQHILRCTHNMSSTQLQQTGSPVITRWYLPTAQFPPNILIFINSLIRSQGNNNYCRNISLLC